MLCLAVLEQALLDLQAPSATLRRDAWEWLTTLRRAALPFAQVCAVLNVDAAVLRRRLLVGQLPTVSKAGPKKARARTRLIAFLREVRGRRDPSVLHPDSSAGTDTGTRRHR